MSHLVHPLPCQGAFEKCSPHKVFSKGPTSLFLQASQAPKAFQENRTFMTTK